MLIAVPHLHPDDHPRLERGNASPRGPPGPVAVAQGGHSKARLRRRLAPQPRLSGSRCQLPADTVPGKPPQLLARANVPKTEAPGRHQEPEGFIGMGRAQCPFFLEQRGVSQLGSCCFEGEVCGWHVNAFERFVAIYFLCFAECGALLHAETGCWGKAAPC